MIQTKSHNQGHRPARKGGMESPGQIRELGEAARAEVGQLRDFVSTSIQKRPIESVLIAMALGALCGRFRRSPMQGVLLSAGAGLAGGLLLAKGGGQTRR